VPADFGYNGATLQSIGTYQPNYVIYLFESSTGVAYGRSKVPAGVASGSLTISAIVEGYQAGNASLAAEVFNITKVTSVSTSGTVAIALGIQFVLELSLDYDPDDVIAVTLTCYSASAVDVGVVGWKIALVPEGSF
jgi:hypothetical protein